MKKGTDQEALDNYVTVTLFIDEGAYAASLQWDFDETLEEDSENYMLTMGYGLIAHLNTDGDRVAELGAAMLMGMHSGGDPAEEEVIFTPEEGIQEEKPKSEKVVSFRSKGNKTRH